MMYTALGEAEDDSEASGGGAVACRGRDNSGCHGGMCVCDTICTTKLEVTAATLLERLL
jgi:hypothetical protein